MNMDQLLNGVVALAALAWILGKQMRPGPVRERSLMPFLFLAAGLVQVLRLALRTPLPLSDVAVLAGSLAVGCALGVARAYSMRLWEHDGAAWRQGGWLNATLWLVSLGLHLGSDLLLHTPDLGQVSILAHLGAVVLVQREVLLLRSRTAGLTPAPREARQRRRAERG